MIVPEAFSHPAKMAYGLLYRILEHIKEQGWANDGSIILDPFGGIGSTGILGAYHDFKVICVELESEFYRESASYECPGITKKEWVRWYNRFRKNNDICPNCHQKAQNWYEKNTGIIPSREPHHYIGNFELHENAWEKLNCPRPVMIQGDSRHLCQIFANCDCIVSSPPYSESMSSEKSGIDWSKCRRENGSLRDMTKEPAHKTRHGAGAEMRYGTTLGQLGAMKPSSVDAILGSPPHADSLKGDGTQKETAAESRAKRRTEGGSLGQSQRTQGYGSNGNLGNLRPGDISAIISSPPWENQEGSMQSNKFADSEGSAKILSQRQANGITGGHYATPAARKRAMDKANQQTYGKSEGQLGAAEGQTFWQTAKVIVEQCHQILREGGYAIWVVKDFVRDKKRVDFTGDWKRLCESVGFKTLHIHHAMLVKEHKKRSLFGHEIIKRKERKSFFRRLAESKGSQRIDYEVVLCMQKKGFLNEQI